MENIGQPVEHALNDGKRSHNILDLSENERRNFLDSFDTILCDCDGVIWKTMQQPIKGVSQGIGFLRKAGKHVVFVTNNSIRSVEDYVIKFRETGIDVDFADVIHPARSIVTYLEEIRFDGLIYCIAAQNFKEVLKGAGFKLIDGPNKILEENFTELAKNVFDKEPVKAVIIDIDFNLSAPKLIRAHLYLKHPECILIGGAADMVIPFGETDIIGPGPYLKVVEKSSGKKAAVLGKPGRELAEMVKKRFNITNPRRILFIGDMLESDMGFGKMCGFQTLVVLSGATKLNDLRNHKIEQEIPDYYVESVADFTDFLNISC